MKKIIPIAGLVVVAIAVWLLFMSGQRASNVPADGWSVYEGPYFTVSYPSGYIVNPSYTFDISPEKRVEGVSFTVDPRMASGTNLGTDTRITVESIPTLSSCNAAAYLDGSHTPFTVVERGKTYSVATSSGAGAGNFYEEVVYVRTDNLGPCPAVHYYIHNLNIQNFPEGTVVEYDRFKLLEEFDKLRLSLETR